MTDEKKDDLERVIFHLKRKIEFNERLKCHRVAARYRRELDKLEWKKAHVAECEKRLEQLVEKRRKGL